MNRRNSGGHRGSVRGSESQFDVRSIFFQFFAKLFNGMDCSVAPTVNPPTGGNCLHGAPAGPLLWLRPAALTHYQFWEMGGFKG